MCAGHKPERVTLHSGSVMVLFVWVRTLRHILGRGCWRLGFHTASLTPKLAPLTPHLQQLADIVISVWFTSAFQPARSMSLHTLSVLLTMSPVPSVMCSSNIHIMKEQVSEQPCFTQDVTVRLRCVWPHRQLPAQYLARRRRARLLNE